MKEYQVFKYHTDKKHTDNFKSWYFITNHNKSLSGEMNLNFRTALATFEEIYGKLGTKDLY